MLTAQIESLTDTLEEMKPAFPEHWRELGLFQDRMPLSPAYALYLAKDAAGEVVLATLRAEGELVGYFPVFVAPGLHYDTTLTATMDILWIRPEFRGLKGGKLIFDCMKAELIRRGVKLWWVGSKRHKPIEWLFEQLGFMHEESYFAMWLGAETPAP